MADLFQKAKELFPNESDDNIQQGITKIKSMNPAVTDEQVISIAQNTFKQTSQPKEQSIQNPMVRDHIQKLYGDKLSNEARQKLVDENKADASGPNWMAGLAALGTGLQGGNSVESGQSFLKNQQSQRDAKLNDFDKQRDGLVKDYDLGRQLKSDTDKDTLQARELDVNSQESKLAQELARRMLPSKDFSTMSAHEINSKIPTLTKIYEVEQKKLDRNDTRVDRQNVLSDKREEKNQALITPYGTANSVADANRLKEAHESKLSFDSKIQEMIDLRKGHGVEYLDREAVARGKQLSKDLLLDYKNMAKLGVLSKADEDIINAIIPADPLGQDWAPGQDSILYKLEKFKQDKDAEFNVKVATRTRQGMTDYSNGKQPSSTNDQTPKAPSSDMVQIKDPKGIVRFIPRSKLAEAIQAGGQEV